jgi:hypothetical protein
MFKKPDRQDGIWAMPREGWDGGGRYDDGGDAEGPSGIRWPGWNRRFTLGRERQGARVSVTMAIRAHRGCARP